MQIFSKKNFVDQRGASMTEYVLVVALLLLSFMITLKIFNKHPELLDKTVLIATGSAFVGAITWLTKQFTRSIDSRAQLLIVEILSDGKPRDRKNLLSLVRQENRIYWLFPSIFNDSLATLLHKGQIQISEGTYFNVQQ